MTILITGREQYPHSADINEKHIRRMFRRLSDEGTRISHFDRNDTHKILNALISGSNEGSEWTEPSQGRTTTESSPRSISQVLNRVIGDGLTRQSGDRLEDGAKDVEPAPVVEGLEDARRGVDVPNPEIPSLPQEHSLVDQEVSPTSPAIETESHDHPATPAVTGNDGSGNGVSPRGKSSGLERFIFKLTCGLFGSE